MEAHLCVNGKKIGTIPYPSLPVFRLYCEEKGFQTFWKEEEKTLFVSSGFTGKTILLQAKNGQQAEMALERTILQNIQSFLASCGLACTIKQKGEPLLTHADIALQLTVHPACPPSRPLWHIFHNGTRKSRRLAQHAVRELTAAGIPSVAKARWGTGPNPVLLDIHAYLAQQASPIHEQDLAETISICLTTALLRFLQEIQPVSMLSCLPSDLLTPFFSPLLSPQESTTQEESKSNSVLDEPSIGAEAFFDVIVILPSQETQPHGIMGNLTLKNTGTADLWNPLILLRAAPPASVKVRGQILPPSLVESLGMQHFTGKKGWKYLHDDWFQRAQESGEYWISPVESLRLPPLEAEQIPFQLTIFRPREGNTVTMEAFIYFQEQKLEIPANNRLCLIFPPEENDARQKGRKNPTKEVYET